MDFFQKWAEEIPLEDVSEQRFGNKAYRKFYEKLCKVFSSKMYLKRF